MSCVIRRDRGFVVFGSRARLSVVQLGVRRSAIVRSVGGVAGRVEFDQFRLLGY